MYLLLIIDMTFDGIFSTSVMKRIIDIDDDKSMTGVVLLLQVPTIVQEIL